jgi:DNA-directed RNA polymerase III subunit RPC1
MNITLGVPRIKEIINFSKDITTPIIKAILLQENDITAAKIVKGRIEKIKLNRICKYIKEVISPHGCYIKVKLDKEYIKSSHLDISIEKVKKAILDQKKLKLRENQIKIFENDMKLKIDPPENDKKNLYFSLELLMKNLPEIIVSGISTVNRIVINKEEDKDKDKDKDKNKKIKYMLVVEGTGLLDIMNTDGIDFKRCTSNNISEILNTLGIEAARKSIIYELNYTFGQHSIKAKVKIITKSEIPKKAQKKAGVSNI